MPVQRRRSYKEAIPSAFLKNLFYVKAEKSQNLRKWRGWRYTENNYFTNFFLVGIL